MFQLFYIRKIYFHIIILNIPIPYYYPFLEKTSTYKIVLLATSLEEIKIKIKIYIYSHFLVKYYLVTTGAPKYRQTGDDVYHDSDVMGSRWREKRELGLAKLAQCLGIVEGWSGEVRLQGNSTMCNHEDTRWRIDTQPVLLRSPLSIIIRRCPI